jgi:threonine aldolase
VTEYGTVNEIDEIKYLAEVAKEPNLMLHMDGSRISNAAVSLDRSFREFTVDAGVDVLSFGGAKNGMMFGEAVVFFNKQNSTPYKCLRKQSMQLHSKMRFIGAQFEALLSNDLWKENAAHSNAMAKLLESRLRDIPKIKITQIVDANSIFALFPKKIINEMQDEYFFYVWNDRTNEVRLMCSFDTQKEDVEGFALKLRQLLD